MKIKYGALTAGSVKLIGSILNFTILIVAIGLLVFSLIGFSSVQYENFKKVFDFSSEGVERYVNSYSKFYGLFGATITLIVVYYGIERLKAAERANADKVKLDRYADWRLVTDLRIELVKDDNPLFRREFFKIRYQLFEELYPAFEIKDYAQLVVIFDKYFRKYIPSFEQNNSAHQRAGGIYPNEQHSFFGDGLESVFCGSLQNPYPMLQENFHKLYIESLSKERVIDPIAYHHALERYYGRPS